MSTPKWTLIIDVARCNGCGNCVIVTKDEHIGNDFPGYAAPQPALGHTWIDLERVERGQAPMIDVTYVPRLCNHCPDAPCVAAGKGAVRRRDDGIVIIDPVAARGRRDLVEACPQGAVWWNEDLQLPQAWIFDAHLLDAGRSAPRCVDACPTGAMEAVRLSDDTLRARTLAEGLTAGYPTPVPGARVLYRHLERATRCFVAGSVSLNRAGIVDCAAGMTVVLRQGGTVVARAVTDQFGQFKIDGLPEGSGAYKITIEQNDKTRHDMEINISHTSVTLDDIMLTDDHKTGNSPECYDHQD